MPAGITHVPAPYQKDAGHHDGHALLGAGLAAGIRRSSMRRPSVLPPVTAWSAATVATLKTPAGTPCTSRSRFSQMLGLPTLLTGACGGRMAAGV